MGFYIRKSVTVGPLRFNLSGAGIGVSTGIPGFRVGTGPRGHYVHMGAGGLYYRAALGGVAPARRVDLQQQPHADASGMVEIESGSTLNMVDASSAVLLEDLNTKLKQTTWWPIVMVATILGLFAASTSGPIFLVTTVVSGAVATWVVYYRDQLRTNVVLMYELEERAIAGYQTFHNAFDELARCGRVGHIAAQGGVADRKRQAGAGLTVRRHVIRPYKRAPSRIRTNIEVPAIPVGRQTLYFLPDRALVIGPEGAGAVGYSELSLETSTTRFIEHQGVPGDAQVVGRTWQYVNKGGGPDRRFKNNPELPIALYEELHFTSATGLNEVLQVSKIGTGQVLRGGLRALQNENIPSFRPAAT